MRRGGCSTASAVAAVLLAAACADDSLLVVRVLGRDAQPTLRAVDDVQRLDVQVLDDGESAWAGQFSVQGEPRDLDETLALRPGSHLDRELMIRARALRSGLEVAQGEIGARFAAGETRSVELLLRWSSGACLDPDGDLHGRGPGCLGSDCDEADAAVHADAGERCNGVDDDCDDAVDEVADLTPQPCARQYGVCVGSRAQCGGAAGWLPCPASAYGAAFQATETACDGFDNDCDGTADPGCPCQPGQTRSCEGFAVGACDPGEQQCQAVGTAWVWRAQCQGVVEATAERCNDLDDDCDGDTDEDFDPEQDPLHCGGCGEACALDQAEAGCVQGRCTIARCLEGYHDLNGLAADGCEYSCRRSGLPGEICNGIDDDCNGEVDDVRVPPPCERSLGVCSGVLPVCDSEGSRPGWLACDYGRHFELTETRCDGMDNDCDGATDEGVQCPSCVTAADCVDDNTCTDDACEGQRCRFVPRLAGADCDDGQYCNTVDRCDHVARCVATGPTPCDQECRAVCDEVNDRCAPDQPGTPCTDDGLFCNGPEVCNGAGSCMGQGNPCPALDCQACDEEHNRCANPAGAPCTDDDVFCNGLESCDGDGQCTHSGDPCPGTPCNTCQEGLDSCADPVATACDDGAFCTGGDHCDGAGGCAPGTSNPCTEQCLTVCRETDDSCQPDALDTPCTDDGVFCNGDESCDGQGLCRPEGVSPCAETQCRHCQEDTDSCFDPAPTPCDDGNGCTHGDTCSGAGACAPGNFNNNVDGDLHINAACGGDDCDDTDPTIPQVEGPICDLASTCRDGRDNDCDTATDLADSGCASAGSFCHYVSGTTFHVGAPGTLLRVYLALPSVDPGKLFCFTDPARLQAATTLAQTDFEAGLGMLTTTTPAQVYTDATAQYTGSTGTTGLMICGAAVATSQAIDATGRSDLVLRYAVRASALINGEYLLAEYSPDGGIAWYLLALYGDASPSVYREYAHVLPPDADDKPDVRVRFRSLDVDGAHCANLDDVSVVHRPPSTARLSMHQSRFETAEGFPSSVSCNSLGPYTATTGGTYACIHSAAQNPATQSSTNTQGLRVLYQASVDAPLVDLSYVPEGEALQFEVMARGVGLESREYAQVFKSDQESSMWRLAAVGMGSPTRYERVRALVVKTPTTQDKARLTLTAPSGASLSTVEGIEVDDVTITWERASYDVVGPFADPGDGSYVAVLQSTQPGLTEITCVYLGSDPPLVTDGSALRSAPRDLIIDP